MSTGTCLRAPAERQSIDSSTAFIQPSVIRLLLKLIGPLLTSAVLVLCSSFDEVRASNRERIEPVVERQTALLCREPRSLYEQGATVSVLRVFIKKPVVLLDDSGRYDETMLLDERPEGCLLYTSPSPRDRG